MLLNPFHGQPQAFTPLRKWIVLARDFSGRTTDLGNCELRSEWGPYRVMMFFPVSLGTGRSKGTFRTSCRPDGENSNLSRSIPLNSGPAADSVATPARDTGWNPARSAGRAGAAGGGGVAA